MKLKADCVLDVKAELGEGPAWDAAAKVLWWVDINRSTIHRYDPATGKDDTYGTGAMVGAVVPRASGGLVTALADGFAFYDTATRKATPIVDPEEDQRANRFNDGKCDPAGRFWAGTMGMDGGKGVGSLYRLDATLKAERMVTGVSCSNGLAWTADAKTMYYIDTPLGTVDAFDFDVDTGSIANRRSVVRIAEGEGHPDGMSIDSEGKLWVAHWGGWQVGRYDPATGKKLGQVDVPAANVTSCAFGGPEGKDLYITTARAGQDEEKLKAQPLAGGLFHVTASVAGPPAAPFAG